MTDDPEPPEYTTEQIEPQGKGNDGGGNGNARRQRRWSWCRRQHRRLYHLSRGRCSTMARSTASPAKWCVVSHTRRRSDPGGAVADLSDELRQRRRTSYPLFSSRTRATSHIVLRYWQVIPPRPRKGTSSDRIRTIFQLADPIRAMKQMRGDMSSGEGLITAVHNPQWVTRRASKNWWCGISDKRLLLYQPGILLGLAVLNREGSILSRVVRDAWDCRPNAGHDDRAPPPTRATEASSTSIVGHITIAELRSAGWTRSQAMADRLRGTGPCSAASASAGFCRTAAISSHERERLGRCTKEALNAAAPKPGVEMTAVAPILDSRNCPR